MTEVTICDKRDDSSVKTNFFVKVDGELYGRAMELHEALWLAENALDTPNSLEQ